jgi:parallel beta-helix repeat protein
MEKKESNQTFFAKGSLLGGENEKMEKNKIAPIVMAAIVALMVAAFAVTPVVAPGNPGAGCVADTDYYDTINGNVYFEQQGYAQNSPMTKTFNNVPGNIKLAKVYTGVWQGSPGKGGFFNITVNAHTTDTYKACDPCPNPQNCLVDGYQDERCDLLNDGINSPWNDGLDKVNMHALTVGCGVQFYSFNATPYVVPGTNTITVKTKACQDCYRGGWDGRIYIIVLLVVYEDQEMPVITYWINEGALYLEKGSDCDGPDDHLYASKYFNGTYVSNPSNVKLWSTGWPHVINATVSPAYTELNNNNIGIPDVTEAYASGYNEALLRWNNIPTGYLTTTNLLEYYDPTPLYERAFAEVLIVQGPSNEPDLTVTDIKFPTVMRPGQSYTIPVTVKNQGDVAAGSFNVSLDIENGVAYSDKENVPSLGIDASTDVDFTYVMLGSGCYNFSVVADCDSDVDESDENNNVKEECYQVGNVIVVGSNAELIAEADRVVGGTYYIEDRTITNCAGNGITIENTDLPFVIRNCEVYDCGVPTCCNKPGNGMLFKNVINGKVNDSEVRTSLLKGIRMEKCSYMVIDNNNVHDNEKYGIDVYMDHMPIIDSHHITITDNYLERNLYGIELFCDECTVRENTVLYSTAFGGGEEGWGMYISGHDNKIYNNTIAYSDSYGLKVDDTWISTGGNCIFGNNIKYNNQLHSHPHQAWDNGVNFWNSTVELGYYFGGIGSSYAFDNYIGNYWDDYTACTDGNNDGICDGTYSIDGGSMNDYHPLVQEWTDYDRMGCGDVDCSSDITIADALKVYNVPYGGSVCSQWAADVDRSGDITIADALKVYNVPYGGVVNCCNGCE